MFFILFNYIYTVYIYKNYCNITVVAIAIAKLPILVLRILILLALIQITEMLILGQQKSQDFCIVAKVLGGQDEVSSSALWPSQAPVSPLSSCSCSLKHRTWRRVQVGGEHIRGERIKFPSLVPVCLSFLSQCVFTHTQKTTLLLQI